MKTKSKEIMVGLFMTAGILCMGYVSIKLGEVSLFNTGKYTIDATFSSASGIKKDSKVEISGVRIGRVSRVLLKDYQALVSLELDNDIKIQDDAIASIKTKGLLGEQYIDILPGGSEEIIENGGELFDTEPPFDLISLIKKLLVDD